MIRACARRRHCLSAPRSRIHPPHIDAKLASWATYGATPGPSPQRPGSACDLPALARTPGAKRALRVQAPASAPRAPRKPPGARAGDAVNRRPIALSRATRNSRAPRRARVRLARRARPTRRVAFDHGWFRRWSTADGTIPQGRRRALRGGPDARAARSRLPPHEALISEESRDDWTPLPAFEPRQRAPIVTASRRNLTPGRCVEVELEVSGRHEFRVARVVAETGLRADRSATPTGEQSRLTPTRPRRARQRLTAAGYTAIRRAPRPRRAAGVAGDTSSTTSLLTPSGRFSLRPTTPSAPVSFLLPGCLVAAAWPSCHPPTGRRPPPPLFVPRKKTPARRVPE